MVIRQPDDEWEARITKLGWWSWSIEPHCGLTGFRYGWTAYGSYERAERKAQRILARLRRKDERLADVRIVR